METGPSAAPLPDAYDPLTALFELELLAPELLTAPSRAAQPFVPEVAPAQVLTPAAIADAQTRTLQQMQRAISRERVRRFALELLGARDSIQGAELAVAGPDELALLIYLRTYGDGSLGYTVTEVADGPWIERAGIGFRDFVLRRGGGTR